MREKFVSTPLTPVRGFGIIPLPPHIRSLTTMSESQDKTKTPGKVATFLKDVNSEFHKITWPRGKELVETTKMATVFILVLAVFVYLCDKVLALAIKSIL